MRNRWKGTVGALSIAIAAAACAQAGDSRAKTNEHEAGKDAFTFALIGDMPYTPAQVPRFDALIDDLGDDKSLRFVMHVGDVKGGAERCDDSLLQARHAQLMRLRHPLVYTPGDNEWTDCHRANNGNYFPLERLAFVRRLFYPDPYRSAGRHPLALTPQSSLAGYGAFVENAMFMRSGVVFSTLHVVGSNNNLAPWNGFDPGDSAANPRADRLAEFAAREKAALAWIDRTFDVATAERAAGVLVLMQANPAIERPKGDPQRVGFEAVLERLKARAHAFGKPVVLAHGDNHEFFIDMPWYRDAEPAPKLPHFTRVQGFGAPRLHWVRVTVDPKSANVFRFDPRLVPGNE